MCVTQPSETGTVSAGARAIQSVELPPFVIDGQEKQPYLTQVVVAINEDVNDSATTKAGPVKVQLWLHRVGGDRLLDSGFIRGGYGTARAVVGIMGSIGYTAGDELHAIMDNFSGADVSVRIAYARDYSEPSELGCESYTTLSTEHSVIWAYRNSYQQTNAAGGAIVFDLTPASENEPFLVLAARAVNTGTNTVLIELLDEDENLPMRYANISSAAGTSASVPAPGGSATASGSVGDSTNGILVSGNDFLTMRQSGAGAQNDDLEVFVRARCWGRPPTRSIARSTNPADVDGLGVTDGTEGTPTVNRWF